jgi:hypothetical protein
VAAARRVRSLVTATQNEMTMEKLMLLRELLQRRPEAPGHLHDSKRPSSREKPYAPDRAHPRAKPRMNPLPRSSSAHITIMKVRATTPNTVVELIGREATARGQPSS